MTTTEKAKRKNPTTVRTAGFEHAKDTDMGTRVPKIIDKTIIQKKRIKQERQTPSTVRTAGFEHVLDTDD